MKKHCLILLLALISLCAGCSDEVLDYYDPDVKLFVKQLKSGTYTTRSPEGFVEVPCFTREHIPELLRYVDDLTLIASFPLPPISSYYEGKTRLGECIMWIIESIRMGGYPSLGCKLVYANAESYAGIYFLSDQDVLEAAECYRRWWEYSVYPHTEWTVSPCLDDPLCGSGYRWW
ncbi:MAG: DUF4943 domain-containing protein [Bacteroides sp.]|nr:DUF4943 domain-containing protein [Bacteroides sp.]